jgi:plasmid stabilization system protein ParE
MNVELGFDFHPGAAEDFLEIWESIADESPLAARRLREEILEEIIRLLPFPHQGHTRPDLTSRPLRFQTVREYLIAYAPDRKPLLVVAILHGRRNPKGLAAILEQRQ